LPETFKTMNKILLLFFLMTSLLAKSQEVSPFYPAKYIGDNPARFTSQMTYFDLNFMNTRTSEFLYYKMAMNVEKSDAAKLLHDGGKLTTTYVDKIAQGEASHLIITYDVVKVSDVYTIQSVKITGHKKRVLSFFINFWKTSINFETPAGNSDVSLNMGQDVVKYFFNKGNPYITVTNSTYKNVDEFKVHFENLKAKEK